MTHQKEWHTIREVQASDVARGETMVIARHGRSITRIVPEASASEVIRRRGADGWLRLARRCEDPLRQNPAEGLLGLL